MKKNLPVSVLLALGLTAGCRSCGKTHVGPCLSVLPDPPPPDETPEPPPELTVCLSVEPPPDTGVGPCLEFAPVDTGPCLDIEPEPPVGPCLKYVVPEEKPEEEEPAKQDPDGGAMLHPSRQETREQVLASGVLPEDVVALLRSRQKS